MRGPHSRARLKKEKGMRTVKTMFNSTFFEHLVAGLFSITLVGGVNTALAMTLIPPQSKPTKEATRVMTMVTSPVDVATKLASVETLAS
jgi:hypothetical protein